MPTVVYHLETHQRPEQVTRLVAALVDSSDALVVVNHDERGDALNESALTKLGAVVHHGRGGYSDLSHPLRWLQTVDWLAANRIEYDWLSNLSGQDYPIRPMSQIHAGLRESVTDAFIETFDVFDPEQSTWGVKRASTRYQFHHRRVAALSPSQKRLLRPVQVINRTQPWVRVTTATGLTVRPPRSISVGNPSCAYGVVPSSPRSANPQWTECAHLCGIDPTSCNTLRGRWLLRRSSSRQR